MLTTGASSMLAAVDTHVLKQATRWSAASAAWFLDAPDARGWCIAPIETDLTGTRDRSRHRPAGRPSDASKRGPQVLEHGAPARQFAQVLVRDDPGVEVPDRERGQHRTQRRVDVTDRSLDDADAETRPHGRQRGGVAVGAYHQTVAAEPGPHPRELIEIGLCVVGADQVVRGELRDRRRFVARRR